MRRKRFCCLVPLLLASGPAFAAEPRVPFPHDPVDYYGSRFLTALLVLGIALLLYSLARYRGRAERPFAWGLLIGGVGVVPPVAVLVGMLLVFERAERVKFCGSCHGAMQAYVDDLRDSGSQSLAAVHYKNRYIPRNQCYVCHTSFGLFGTVRAKVAGVVDVHKYYTRSFQAPLRMRERYSNTECLKCHGEALRWSSRHGAIRRAVFGGQTGCLHCHGQTHPAHILAR